MADIGKSGDAGVLALQKSGGVVTRTQDFEPGGQVLSRGRVADHHPCEQKQRGGEFSHNAKLQFSGTDARRS